MHRIAQRLALQLLTSMLRGLTLPMATLALFSIASGCAPATIALVQPDTGARTVCSNPASSEEAVALLKRLPPPMVFGAWGALEAQYATGPASPWWNTARGDTNSPTMSGHPPHSGQAEAPRTFTRRIDGPLPIPTSGASMTMTLGG